MPDTLGAGRFAAETMSILVDSNAILADDHFVYISGDHGSGWIDKDAIFLHTDRVERLCRELANEIRTWNAEVICGPATGGMVIAEWTANELGVLSIFTEHDPTPRADAVYGRFILRRGYDQVVPRKRVLIVDDIVNTGSSLRQTAEAVRAAGGKVVGGACLVSRGNVDAVGLGVSRFDALLEYKIPAWPESACELCRTGVPINTRFAHGSEYVARRAGTGA